MSRCRSTDVFGLYVVSIADGVLKAVVDDGETIMIRGHVTYNGTYVSQTNVEIPYGTFQGTAKYRGEIVDFEVHYKGDGGVMLPTTLTICRASLVSCCASYAKFMKADGTTVWLIPDADQPWEPERGIFVGHPLGFREKLMVIV